jgi:hypothetical protein
MEINRAAEPKAQQWMSGQGCFFADANKNGPF